MKKYIILIVVLLILLLVPLVTLATKNVLMFNPENGKPVVVAEEESPEELIGKEVSLLVPIKPNETEELNVSDIQIKSEEELKQIEEITTEDKINPEDDVIRIAAEEEKNRMESFYNTLSDYYGDDLINKIKREMSEDTSAGFPEAGKVLLNCVIEMCEDSSVTVENKMILKDVAQSIVKLNNVNDEELENKINDL